MWQIVWMLNLLPDWFFHALLALGVLGIIASYILKRIPFISTYNTPLRIISILLIIGTVWVEGGRDVQSAWEAKVADMQKKVEAAEAASALANRNIEEKVVTKTKVIREKGQVIYQYIDREVVKDKEVIKFVENCPIPPVIVKTLNAAALNQPVEEKK